MTISFTCHQLIFDGASPEINSIRKGFDFQENELFSYDGNSYVINSVAIDDNYFWIHSKYGNDQWGEEVVNKKTKATKPNPRSKDEPELNKQLFCLYDFNAQELFISDFNKRALFQKIFSTKTSQKVEIKNFHRNPQEFIDAIHSIKYVSFVAKNDLFTHGSNVWDVLPNPQDIYGLGLPDKLYVRVDFKKAEKTQAFLANFFKMNNWKSSNQAEKFVCAGFDDRNIEQVFNPDSFMSKVTLELKKDDKGFYEPDSVRVLIIEKLRKHDNAQ